MQTILFPITVAVTVVRYRHINLQHFTKVGKLKSDEPISNAKQML